jgi:hypothetical protein
MGAVFSAHFHCFRGAAAEGDLLVWVYFSKLLGQTLDPRALALDGNFARSPSIKVVTVVLNPQTPACISAFAMLLLLPGSF